MIHVIFFDQWFTSITQVIADLKGKYGNKLRVVACSENENHAYKSVVDEFIVADWRQQNSDESLSIQYTTWLKNTIVANNVDIAFLRKYPNWVVENQKMFEHLEADIVMDIKNIAQFSSKSAIYNSLSLTKQSWLIPKYYLLSKDRYEINNILKDYMNSSKEYCLKLDSEEGGQSFRKISKNILYGVNRIMYPPLNKLTPMEVQKMLEEYSIAEQNQEIMFMEYLHGPEISVDCLRLGEEFIAICREKVSSNRSEIVYCDNSISELCEQLQQTFNIKGPFNVQFRWAEKEKAFENMRLTDINFRMSGGIYLETSVGCNICELYIANKLGFSTTNILNNFKSLDIRTVTHYEHAIKI